MIIYLLRRSLKLYSREELIKVLEEYGYVKNDIQKGNVSGDQLHFALLILINQKLDRDSRYLTPNEKREKA